MKTFLPWLGAIVSESISGFAHGAVAGGPVGVVVTGDIKKTAVSALIGGAVGAAKDVALYINANPMPNVFAQPTIAPASAPVAQPTIADQTKTPISVMNQPHPSA